MIGHLFGKGGNTNCLSSPPPTLSRLSGEPSFTPFFLVINSLLWASFSGLHHFNLPLAHNVVSPQRGMYILPFYWELPAFSKSFLS